MAKVVTRYYLQGASVRVRYADSNVGVTLSPGDVLIRKKFTKEDWEILDAKGYIHTHKHEVSEPSDNPTKTSSDGAGTSQALTRDKLQGKKLDELNIMATERGRDPQSLFEDTETAIQWLTKNATN